MCRKTSCQESRENPAGEGRRSVKFGNFRPGGKARPPPPSLPRPRFAVGTQPSLPNQLVPANVPANEVRAAGDPGVPDAAGSAHRSPDGVGQDAGLLRAPGAGPAGAGAAADPAGRHLTTQPNRSLELLRRALTGQPTTMRCPSPGGANSRRQGCPGRRTGPGTWLSPPISALARPPRPASP